MPTDDPPIVQYSAELEDGLTAKAWGIPVHIWETFPRWSRAKMSAIRKHEGLISYAVGKAMEK